MNSLLLTQIGMVGLLVGGAGLLMLESGLFRKYISQNSGQEQASQNIGKLFVYIIFGISAGLIVSNILYLLYKKIFPGTGSTQSHVMRRNSREGSRRWREFMSTNQQASRVFSTSTGNNQSWPPSYDNFAIENDKEELPPGYKTTNLPEDKLPNYDEVF